MSQLSRTDDDLIARVRELKRRVDALESTAPDAVFNEAMSHLNAEYLNLAPQLAERLAETRAKVEQMREAVDATATSPGEPMDAELRAQLKLGRAIKSTFDKLFPAPAHADTERT